MYRLCGILSVTSSGYASPIPPPNIILNFCWRSKYACIGEKKDVLDGHYIARIWLNLHGIQSVPYSITRDLRNSKVFDLFTFKVHVNVALILRRY